MEKITEEQFKKVLWECINTPELIKEYERLRGVSLINKNQIFKLIDEATGYQDRLWEDFFDFVRDYIYLPVFKEQIYESTKK